MDLQRERDRLNREFLVLVDNLIELNNPFNKTINNNSGKSVSLTLCKNSILSKINPKSSVKDFIDKYQKVKCAVVGGQYLLLKFEK